MSISGGRMYVLEIEIQGLPPTTNNNGRQHWSIKAKHARLWKALVRAHVGEQKPQKPLAKARIEYTRISTTPPDFDGLVSSFKALQDGLVDCGVLEDDKMKNVIPTYRHEAGKRGKGAVRIKVEELA